MNILLLGGTSDARKLVQALDQSGLLASHRLIYSVAGLVRIPELPCEVISGGFSKRGGLTAYLDAGQIDLLLDVTHPFACQMSTTALTSARARGIPCWRFHREPWQAGEGDRWRLFSDWQALLRATRDYRSILLTAGQLTQADIDWLAAQAQSNAQQQVLRTAAPPQAELHSAMQWLKAIGPFRLEQERALLQQYKTDLLISKNSGGAATQAKLSAARELGIEVFMLERPELPPADRLFHTIERCAAAVAAYCHNTD
ncbi:precorrin-6A/cobalt-precorrin-6A reductase [Neptuniibacter halophilus]|uniref:precorrin-6A/cobalt-precorrin-6A reductase n=1 Tax=Neptuniibacter halophilus TaxID=651666 RepID=UPI00257434F9|nr:precorrin-6A/cobalt-precorrin-6A reductase [Neptuniibacter halophilus]